MIPLPPSPKPSGELNVNEYGYILDDCIRGTDRNNAQLIMFIEAFVRCKSISQASEEAGINAQIGYRYRHRKDVGNAIQKIIDKSLTKYGFDGSEVVERAKEIVDFDPIKLINADGTYKNNLHDIDPATRRNIKSLKVKNIYQQTEDLNGMKSKIIVGEVIEYTVYDKLKAIELVGKEKELFKSTTRIEHDVTKDMKSILLASTQRADRAIEAQNKEVIETVRVKEEYEE